MNRLIAVTIGLLLGASAVTASAQGRDRDEGNREDHQENRAEHQEQRQQAVEELQGHSQDKPQHSAPGQYAPAEMQQEHTQAWGRQDRGEGGRRDHDNTRGQTQGFGVPVEAAPQAQDYSGGQRHGGRQRDQTQSHREVYGLANPGHQQSNGRDGRGGYRDHNYRGDRRGWDINYGYGSDYRHGRHDGWSGRHSWRNDWNHGWSGNRWRSPSRYYYPRGHSRMSWSIGFNLPRAFYGPTYYVDYRPYGLAPPPYGYRWIRADGDILLVHLASGEVVDVLDDFFY